MKRRKPKSLRARRTGQSPYQKHHKAPYRYSGAYYAWKAQFVRLAGRDHLEGERNAH